MKLKIKGDIIDNDSKWLYDLFEIDATCPKDVDAILDACEEGEPLDVEISSGGGMIHAGSEIYTALLDYKKGPVTIKVTGLAASAASVIAMAGRCEMSPTALMMIHNVSGGARGDYRDMEHFAEILRTANESLITAYARKTGLDRKELARMMDKETWITAERAVELGFADAIIGDAEIEPLVASTGLTINPEAIEKIRAMMRAKEAEDTKTKKARAWVELEMLKGAEK